VSVVNVAVPAPNAAVPSVLAPSMKVTVPPVGVTLPLTVSVTVAVSVRSAPAVTDAADAASTRAVGAEVSRSRDSSSMIPNVRRAGLRLASLGRRPSDFLPSR
jgi:hypothetical protein